MKAFLVLLQLIDPEKRTSASLARELVVLRQVGGHVSLDGGLCLVRLAAVVATERAFVRVRAQVRQQQALVLARVSAQVAPVQGAVRRLVVPLHGADGGEGGAARTTRALSLKRLSVVVQSLVHTHQMLTQPQRRASSALQRRRLRVCAPHVPRHPAQRALHSAAQLAPAARSPSPPSANTTRATPQILPRSFITFIEFLNVYNQDISILFKSNLHAI